MGALWRRTPNVLHIYFKDCLRVTYAKHCPKFSRATVYSLTLPDTLQGSALGNGGALAPLPVYARD